MYPLELPSGTCDEVRASHCLEHVGHRTTEKMLAEWVRVLKPGGLMKLAVPDMEYISRRYLSGAPGQYQGWLYGGQTDSHDVHLAGFDWDSLGASMRRCGLAGIHKWEGHDDCSALEVSLNMAGYRKPAWPKVIAVMSAPRLGFMDNFGSVHEALLPMGIDVLRRTGAYWGKCMAIAMKAAVEQGAEWILTIDYDTVFSRDDVEDLLMFALVNPDVDALVPVQMGRDKNRILMRPKGNHTGRMEMPLSDWDVTYYPLATGHFGLTLFRASSLQKMEKPWFKAIPDEDGEWEKLHVDEDIYFWQNFEKSGLNAFLAPRVVVGHMENVIIFPDRKLNKVYESTGNWWLEGKPRNVWR